MNAYKAYWDNLNERDRWMLGFGGVCCALFLMYMLLYAPLINAVRNKTQQLNEKQEILVWMQQARQQHKAVKSPQTLSNSKLLSVLADQLKATSFHAFSYRLQQTGTGDIQLSFVQVPYNAFVTWLWSVSQKYAFSIKQFSADKTGTTGVVKISVTFMALG